MKRILLGCGIFLLLSVTIARLLQRWREESADRHVTLLVDWSEVRDEAARQSFTDEDLLDRLHQSGANALLVGAATVQDYLLQEDPNARPDGIQFSSRALAETVKQQLTDRGVAGVSIQASGTGKFRLVSSLGNWNRLKDLEVGFNPDVLGKARDAGFHLVLRLNHDPWLSQDKLFQSLEAIKAAQSDLGFLLDTDQLPGGADALPAWQIFFKDPSVLQLLFEFHPTKSTMKLGLQGAGFHVPGAYDRPP